MLTSASLKAPIQTSLWTESNRALELLESRWALLNPSNEEHVFDVDEESFHSVTTWVPTLKSVNARGDNTRPWRRHVVDFPVAQIHLLTRTVQLLLLLAVLAFLTARPWRPPASPVYEWAGLFAVIPLVFPHQQIYSFLFAFPRNHLAHPRGMVRGPFIHNVAGQIHVHSGAAVVESPLVLRRLPRVLQSLQVGDHRSAAPAMVPLQNEALPNRGSPRLRSIPVIVAAPEGCVVTMLR